MLEGDYAGGQTSPGVRKYVATMEGMRIVGARAAVDALVDLVQSFGAVAFGDQAPWLSDWMAP